MFKLLLFVSMNIYANPYQGEMLKLFDKNMIDERNHVKIIKPEFKVGQCLMFAKNGESYWKPRESSSFYIESQGEYSYKIKQLFFVSDRHYYANEPSKSLAFKDQEKFYLYECPKESDEIKGEALEKLLKDLKNK